MEKKTFKEILCTRGGRFGMILLLYITIFGLFAIIASIVNANPALQIITYIYIVIFAYFGWKALNKIQPSMFIILPIIGWVIYFMLKFILAAVVGMFVAPFVISKKIVSHLYEKAQNEDNE